METTNSSLWEPLSTAGLDAYFERISYDGSRAPELETLRALHLAHATHTPFENLDIQRGLPIRLDLPSLQAKLVQARRGGYCFEHNTLFAAALEALGFNVRRLAARVGPRTSRTRTLTHMLLAVEADGADWLADVGFGANTVLLPLPLPPGPPVEQYGWRYRLEAEGRLRVLQELQDGAWADLYSFTLEERYPIDYVVANHYTSTHPDSGFVRTLTVQQAGTQSRLVLRKGELIESWPDAEQRTAVEDDVALMRVLAERFGIHLPANSRFRSREFWEQLA